MDTFAHAALPPIYAAIALHVLHAILAIIAGPYMLLLYPASFGGTYMLLRNKFTWLQFAMIIVFYFLIFITLSIFAVLVG